MKMETRQVAIRTYTKWSNLWHMWKEIKLAGIRYYIFFIMDILAQILVPVSLVFLPARAVQLLQQSVSIISVLIEVASWISAILLINVMKTYCHERIKLLASLMCDAQYWYKIQQHQLSCDILNLENVEQRKLLNEIRHGLWERDGSGGYAGVIGMYINGEQLLVNTIGFLIFSVLAGGLHPILLVILIVTSLMNCYVKHQSLQYEVTHMDVFWDNADRFWYLKQESRNMAKAKDIRMYHLYDTFQTKLHKNTEEANQVYQDIMKHHRNANMFLRFSTLIQYASAYGFMMMMMKQGSLSVATFVAYIGIVAGFSTWVSNIVESYARLTSISTHFSVYRSYINDTCDEVSTKPSQVPQSIQKIVFEDVSFGYGEKLIFDHFSLTLHASEKIALVGVNGAGKTTLTKLLCGLYPLTNGRILIDGIDIATMDQECYRACISILFQDFHVLPFSISENVACCWNSEYETMERNECSTFIQHHHASLHHHVIYDEQRVIECLKQTKLYEKVETLEYGIHTPLTQNLDPNGIELSGGQTQRLMLARALYKNAPILILDEPTSALDPIAESELYEEYASLCDRKISIFISHRLSSTKFCDRILFMEHGCIVEEGTHEELMKKNGRYAYMYQVQAHYYQKEVEKYEAGI